MSLSSSLRTEIYREVFDENSAPSEEEVRDYAIRIGINPVTEPQLLNIARDGLMQALPEGWAPCYDNETKSFYYYNAESKETRWDHPLDDVYRNIVKKVRSGSNISSIGDEDSKTSMRDELRSYEETTMPSEMLPKPLDSLRPLGGESGGVIKKSSLLAPLKRGVSPFRQVSSPELKDSTRPDARKLSLPVRRGPESPRPLIDLSMKRSTSNAELGTRGALAAADFGSAESLPARSPMRIDVTAMGATPAEVARRSLSPLQEKHPRGFAHARAELTLKGGGSMFLKSKQKRDSPDAGSTEVEPGQASEMWPIRSAGFSSRPADGDAFTLSRVARDESDLNDIPLKAVPGDPSIFQLKDVASEESFQLKDVASEESFQLKDVASEESFQLKDVASEESFQRKDVASEESLKLKSVTSGESLKLKDVGSVGSEESVQLKGVGSEGSESNGGQPKSILREAATPLPPWDSDPRAMTLEEKQQWRRQQLEEERKSVRFDLDKGIGSIRFDVSDSEDADEWTGDDRDPDTDPDREIAGVKVTRILSLMDSTDGAAGSDGDGSREEPPARSEQSLADKLKGLYLPRERGDDAAARSALPAEMFGAFRPSEKAQLLAKGVKAAASINGKDLRKEHAIKDAAAKITEKRQLGSSLFRHDALSKSVESLVLNNGEVDAESVDSLVLEHGEVDADRPAGDWRLRARLDEEEQREKLRLRAELEQRVAAFQAALQAEQEAVERSARDSLDASLKQARLDLSAERERQTASLQRELELAVAAERARLEAELSDALARARHDHAAEKARLAKDAARSNQAELDALAARLAHEMQARQAELEERHSQDLRELECRVKASSLAEVDSESERAREVEREALRASHAAELEALRTSQRDQLAQLTATHDRMISELTESHKRMVSELTDSHDRAMSELTDSHDRAMSELADSHDRAMAELSESHGTEIERLRLENNVELAAARVELTAAADKLRAEHATRLEVLRADCVREEESARRDHLDRLTELKARLEAERQRLKGHFEDKDTSGLVFEKMRCEKRLLEDKYRTLKDKYVRLKGDVKLSVERRRKRDTAANTTGSETERSTSHRATTDRSAVCDSLRAPKNDNEKVPRPKRSHADNNNTTNTTASKNLQSQLPCEEVIPGVESDLSSSSSRPAARPADPPHARKRRQLVGNNNHASPGPGRDNNHAPLGAGPNNNLASLVAGSDATASESAGDGCPVENLRRQLQKLDDLEEQFPAATHTDTYLRYPFSDTGQFGSAELEFFRHRIHLERDSVRRAKDFLVAQRGSFRSRRRDLERRQAHDAARNTLAQLGDEERQLTDMEVSLHRTRGLLGEKVIRLRHLEQALHRASTPRNAGDDATLSDVSSHSGGSSGFNSIELPHDGSTGVGTDGNVRRSAHPYQESTEIIRSLENLNTEIRDIWDVLHKSRPSATPPPALAFPDWLRQPGSRGDPSLAERTKTLRDWLRQARFDSGELAAIGQDM